MSKGFNYSKWDNIELSDDESDLHPNIDKDSWFRMKHRSRLEREAKEDAEMEEFDKLTTQDQSRINIINATMKNLQSGDAADEDEVDDMDALMGELKELQSNIDKRNKRIKEIKEKRAWNIDNICKVKEEKTVVTKTSAASLKADDFEPTGETESFMKEKEKEKEESVFTKTETTATASTKVSTKPVEKSKQTAAVTGPKQVNSEKYAAVSYNDYVISKEEILETYSDIQDLEKTKEYLFKHCDVLLHEHSQSYMLLSCLEDEMNGKRTRMKQVCRQSQILSHIQELAVSMGRDPRDVILPFFNRLELAEHLKGFTTSWEDFIEKIKKRAIEKRIEMDKEKGGEVQPGPGGLNPMEVLAALPAAMRDAFESQEIERLHKVIAEMDPKECRKYMKMCVDSGLWVSKDPHEFDEVEEEIE